MIRELPDRRSRPGPVRAPVRDGQGRPTRGRAPRPRSLRGGRPREERSTASSGGRMDGVHRPLPQPRPVGVRISACSSGTASRGCKILGHDELRYHERPLRALPDGSFRVGEHVVARPDPVRHGHRRPCDEGGLRLRADVPDVHAVALRRPRAAGTVPMPAAAPDRSVRTAAAGRRRSGSTPRRTSRRSRRRTDSRDG